MSKSPLSMPRPGWLMSSQGDHWQSSPQPRLGEVEATEDASLGDVPVVVGGTVLRVPVGTVLLKGLGRVELTPEG